MIRILKCLYRINVLTPLGLKYLLQGLIYDGKTMIALLYFTSKLYPNQTALIQNEERISYAELYGKSLNLASNLVHLKNLKHGDRVALLVRNSIDAVITLFALSRTGAHVSLLNPEISKKQFVELCSKCKFDFVVYEIDQLKKVSKVFPSEKCIVLTGTDQETVHQLIQISSGSSIRKRKAGNIVVLSGGTTGNLRPSGRKQSISTFFNPLAALIEKMQLHKYKSVYIPTPIYHGYGLAALLVAVLLGKEIYFANGFYAKEACSLIEKNQVEVITLVPLMLTRILSEDPQSLKSIKRILSGGAALNPNLITQNTKELGPCLYNLYGTTEAGFCILGTPRDLELNPLALGRPIKGVQLRIRSGEEIGMLEIKCKWSMTKLKNRWIETGDLATIDSNNLICLKGRSDSMIVSGGENVYPKELEDELCLHEQIKTSAVIGIADIEFGERLKAFVVLKPNEKLSEMALNEWLRKRVARYQMPGSIQFLDELPTTAIGKIDKSQLS